MPARRCRRRWVMIRGRAEALQEASGDHHRRQKALAPGGEGKDLLRANCRLRAWRTISQLFRTNRGQPRPRRPSRSASARPCRLYRRRELPADGTSVICSAVSCPAAHDSTHNHCGQARAEQPIWALASHPRPGSQYRSDRRPFCVPYIRGHRGGCLVIS